MSGIDNYLHRTMSDGQARAGPGMIMEKKTGTTVFFYFVAVVVSIAAVYLLNAIYNPPQPLLHINYSYKAQAATGYINDTLGFPINVTSTYCTMPSGSKMVFRMPFTASLVPGSNTFVTLGTSNGINLSTSCGNWKVTYQRTAFIPTTIPFYLNYSYGNSSHTSNSALR